MPPRRNVMWVSKQLFSKLNETTGGLEGARKLSTTMTRRDSFVIETRFRRDLTELAPLLL